MKKILILISIIFLIGCKCTETATLEVRTIDRWHHDTLRTSDSIYIHDSVTVTLMGDTVVKYKERLVYRDRWKEVVRIDSFIRCDTIIRKEYVYDEGAQKECRRLKLTIAVAIIIYLVYWAKKNRR